MDQSISCVRASPSLRRGAVDPSPAVCAGGAIGSTWRRAARWPAAALIISLQLGACYGSGLESNGEPGDADAFTYDVSVIFGAASGGGSEATNPYGNNADERSTTPHLQDGPDEGTRGEGYGDLQPPWESDDEGSSGVPTWDPGIHAGDPGSHGGDATDDAESPGVPPDRHDAGRGEDASGDELPSSTGMDGADAASDPGVVATPHDGGPAPDAGADAEAPPCDDGNPCTVDLIGAGICSNQPLPANHLCDDGDPCTSDDRCVQNACVGTPMHCDDGDICTNDLCTPNGCEHVPGSENALCNDGDPCTNDDRCSAGACAGLPVSCDDGNPCTVSSCLLGVCQSAPIADGEPCNDGNPCTNDDECAGGVCSGDGLVCDDGNTCTRDTCTNGACVHLAVAIGASCDDGEPCTRDDVCAGAICAGTPVVCDDGDPCTVDACGAGGCVHTLAPIGTACNDGDACTTDDFCNNGDCFGSALSCDDGDPCTVDLCDAGACLHDTLEGMACNDNDLCTVEDHCQEGLCLGVPVICVDNNPCTEDRCHLGQCAHLPARNGTQCDDNDPCTRVGHCSNGQCMQVVLTCNDDNPCTFDFCWENECRFEPADGGQCNDGDHCTRNDFCEGGACTGNPVICADDNPCTTDRCHGGGCQNLPAGDGLPCDDGDPCTEEGWCHGANCEGQEFFCDDFNMCTADACVDGECIYTFIQNGPCTDADPCTTDDHCEDRRCVGRPVTCDDGNPCTLNTCVHGGCMQQNLRDGIACDDGHPCTRPGFCHGGRCDQMDRSCDDGNPCTQDRCGPTGCEYTHAPNMTLCAHGVCVDGICLAE